MRGADPGSVDTPDTAHTADQTNSESYSLHFRWFVQTRDRYLAVASRAIFCCRCSHIRISRRGYFIVKHLHSHPILSLSPLLRTFKFEYFVFNKEIGWIRPVSPEHSRGGVEGGEKSLLTVVWSICCVLCRWLIIKWFLWKYSNYPTTTPPSSPPRPHLALSGAARTRSILI